MSPLFCGCGGEVTVKNFAIFCGFIAAGLIIGSAVMTALKDYDPPPAASLCKCGADCECGDCCCKTVSEIK